MVLLVRSQSQVSDLLVPPSFVRFSVHPIIRSIRSIIRHPIRYRPLYRLGILDSTLNNCRTKDDYKRTEQQQRVQHVVYE